MVVLFTMLVPLSFWVAWRLTDFVTGTVAFDRETVRQGEQTEAVFSIINSSWFCALRGTWLLTIGNSFYQTFDSQKLLLSVPPHGKKHYKMTVTLTNLGRIVFACNDFFITDFLGIFAIHTGCTIENRLFVLPKSDGSSQEEIPDVYSGVAELSESQRKGNDYSEVSDIRTYQPGDRPRDIHWKLSARQPELMVKERVSLSGSEHVLLLELPDDRQQAEKLLTAGYHKIKGLLDKHMAVRLLVWNNHQFSFESYSCTCINELETAFCEIFQTDLLSHSSDMLHQYMKNCYPQLESYLCVMSKDDSIALEICVNG
ncbi:MAG: DUF58 domain-containing protein [Lachnospiraceae bacterium]|nr:DUF58 domain-containing protein [Lachnospiraceae bacterium]